MIPPPPHGPELSGPLLARLRLARGWSQAQFAARLCAAAEVATLSRHEISCRVDLHALDLLPADVHVYLVINDRPPAGLLAQVPAIANYHRR